jgi:hypothetical protein
VVLDKSVFPEMAATLPVTMALPAPAAAVVDLPPKTAAPATSGNAVAPSISVDSVAAEAVATLGRTELEVAVAAGVAGVAGAVAATGPSAPRKTKHPVPSSAAPPPSSVNSPFTVRRVTNSDGAIIPHAVSPRTPSPCQPATPIPVLAGVCAQHNGSVLQIESDEAEPWPPFTVTLVKRATDRGFGMSIKRRKGDDGALYLNGVTRHGQCLFITRG